MKAVIREIDGVYWVCCGRCGHKLCKLMSCNKRVFDEDSIEIEFKCQSCKKINILNKDCHIEVVK